MFGLFKKDKESAIRKQYERLLKEARDIQRSGDIKAYALKMEEAENLAKQMSE